MVELIGALGAALGLVSGVFTLSALGVDCPPGGCHGEVKWDPSPDNHGAKMVLNVECLYLPDTRGNFVTAEMWVGKGEYWVEHGMNYGAPWGAERVWFWGDKRPGHVPRQSIANEPHALNTDYGNKITLDSDYNNWWNLFHTGELYKTSKDSFGEPSTDLHAGVETTTDEARVIVHVKDLEWEKTNGNWQSPWEASGVADPVLHNYQDVFNIYWISVNKSATVKLHAQQC